MQGIRSGWTFIDSRFPKTRIPLVLLVLKNLDDRNDIMTNSDDKKQNSKVIYEGTLGTFSGVFTPSILTILGIILFLRLG
jgi:hypothetical protein